TPSRLRMLLDAADGVLPGTLRTVLVGGEKLPPALAARLAALPGIAAFNVYGPTETTIWSTAQQLGSAPLSIGRPLPGERVVILSRDGRPRAIGQVGEIGIGGAGLARGYLGRPDLTGERHLPDPLRPGERLYRSGDLGCLRDDGTLAILGRADDQLKLRGHRIEPGEIEALLGALPGVRQSLVCARGEDDAAELIAYAAVLPGTAAAPLRAALARQLPAWMVPAHVVVLDAFPLQPSGKVDRRRLPAPDATATQAGGAPRDALETRLATVFAELLGCEPPGVDDDFFALGGHSLRAVQLLARLRREFSRELRLSDVLAAPSVRGLADLLRATVPAATHAIAVLPDAPSHALSTAQRRMWVLEQMAPGSAYLLPAAFHVTGALDIEALRRALDALASRHEALRTIFPLIDGEPRQVILPPRPVPLDIVEAPEGDAAAMRAFFARPFDLETEPALRVAVLRHGAASHTLLVALHHIAGDGHSLGILQRDLSRLYSLAPGRPAPPPPKYRPRDIAAWGNALLEGPEAATGRAYWHNLLSGELAPPALLPDKPRPAVADSAGATYLAPLGLAESNTLRRLARVQGATPFMAVAALVALLLHRQGERDVRLGFPVAGRSHPDVQDVVGVFINTLVLRPRVDPEADFAALLDTTREGVLGALGHQSYPFDGLVEELGVTRDPGRSPIFDVMVTFEERGPGALRLGALPVRPVTLPVTDSRFDLTFSFADDEDGGLLLALEYRTALFTPGRVARFADQLRTLLAGLAETPASPVGDLPLLCAADHAIVAAANDTGAAVPRTTLAAMLLAQVARNPLAEAVIDEAGMLTYRDLALAAGGIAERLAGIDGIGPGACVGLLAERGTAGVAGLFGIVLSGAAWVPLDPALPEARMRALLADSGCRAIVVSGPGFIERAAALGSLPIIDATATPPARELPTAPAGVGPGTLAYVIYTSGTTGTPKGVMVHHQAAANLAFWLDRDIFAPLGGRLRHAAMASLIFDGSVQEILGSLPRGDALVMVPEAVKRDPRLLDDFLWRHRVDTLEITPSLLGAALDAGLWAERCGLRCIEVGAETFTRALVDKVLAAPHRRHVALWNFYGPTECCVDSIFHRILPDERGVTVPIGRPVTNTRVHLLDERLRPVPPGAAGEICIAGAGVSLGYLGQQNLTAERFLDLPGMPGERIYRSGDIAVLREDGVLQFIGRRDHQVKIRGYRIELSEIEHHLLSQSGMHAAVVQPDPTTGDALACWYVADDGCEPEALRDALTAVLPPWMVPASFTPVAALPLTISGKLDRAALPPPRRAAPLGGPP
ncbi:MAG: tycC4, partial [Roseomonas sp.]|nr:tycC4 [Roseomonas sp.]